MRRLAAHAAFASAMIANLAEGDVVEFFDRSSWEEAVGDFATIDFTEHPAFTTITDQYADLGITFTDGNDFIIHDAEAYPNDGAGLNGTALTAIVFAFEVPHRWVSAEFPGVVDVQLFRDGELVHLSTVFGGSGAGFFGGLVSDEPFDTVLVRDPINAVVSIDDLHFGGAIPAPSVLVPLAAMARPGVRRRHV